MRALGDRVGGVLVGGGGNWEGFKRGSNYDTNVNTQQPSGDFNGGSYVLSTYIVFSLLFT